MLKMQIWYLHVLQCSNWPFRLTLRHWKLQTYEYWWEKGRHQWLQRWFIRSNLHLPHVLTFSFAPLKSAGSSYIKLVSNFRALMVPGSNTQNRISMFNIHLDTAEGEKVSGENNANSFSFIERNYNAYYPRTH